jgi:ABC-type glycerol-3-phosphate transport system permease component
METIMKIKMGKDKIIFNLISSILVITFSFVCLLPFYLILVGSFTSENTILMKGYSLFPSIKDFSVAAYKIAFKNPTTIVSAYGVTLFVTITGTLIAILISTMTGYVLSRPDFPWRNGISFFFFFTTLFNGGLVPWYLLCTKVFHGI